jgi:hypothetical protein
MKLYPLRAPSASIGVFVPIELLEPHLIAAALLLLKFPTINNAPIKAKDSSPSEIQIKLTSAIVIN